MLAGASFTSCKGQEGIERAVATTSAIDVGSADVTRESRGEVTAAIRATDAKPTNGAVLDVQRATEWLDALRQRDISKVTALSRYPFDFRDTQKEGRCEKSRQVPGPERYGQRPVVSGDRRMVEHRAERQPKARRRTDVEGPPSYLDSCLAKAPIGRTADGCHSPRRSRVFVRSGFAGRRPWRSWALETRNGRSREEALVKTARGERRFWHVSDSCLFCLATRK